MDLSEVTALLDPKPLQLEMGYERLPSGGLHVAVRTDMHGCTGEMLEWWVRWRCDTQKYIWWHPIDHTYSSWQGNLSDDTHVGSEHVVTEYFSGQPADDLVIQFRDPSEFFDEDAYSRARESGAVSGVVVGRLGVTHNPPRLPDGRVLGGRLLHIARDTEWGMALRSHFFIGHDLETLGQTAEQIAAQATVEFAQGLLQHAYDEFTFLSRFLPSLYVAENRDVSPPRAPW
ncbi:DAPG hydrolase family protein [Rhodococcus sp. 008]|uniref:DAPG hydrolase family protein n=1 Tax=Rhodococcus sp. 008 TaxID=1723645 RepID=UPI0008062E7B|nr:hypothetical protein [Rhodococcus sp. 008]ANQ72230.1 hypothetical protein AOT96_16240 [Rhodococcus sp. 008]